METKKPDINRRTVVVGPMPNRHKGDFGVELPTSCIFRTSGTHCKHLCACKKHIAFAEERLPLSMDIAALTAKPERAGTLCRYDILYHLSQRHFRFRKRKRACYIFYIVRISPSPIHNAAALRLRNFRRLPKQPQAVLWQDIFPNSPSR